MEATGAGRPTRRPRMGGVSWLTAYAPQPPLQLSNNDRTIRSFREAFPLVSLTLEEFLSNELIERLRNEQMDAAIVHTRVERRHDLTSFLKTSPLQVS